MKKIKFLIPLLFLLPVAFGFSERTNTADCTCSAPSNFTLTNQTSSTVSFSWTGCGCVYDYYQLRYTREEDSYSSGNFTTTNTYYTFNNITTGTYRFYLRTICGEESSYEIWYDVQQN